MLGGERVGGSISFVHLMFGAGVEARVNLRAIVFPMSSQFSFDSLSFLKRETSNVSIYVSVVV